MADKPNGRKGVPWKPLHVKSMSKQAQGYYSTHIVSREKLLEQLHKDWRAKYPKGKNAEDATFNILGGHVMYAMIPHIDGDIGDNVFA